APTNNDKELTTTPANYVPVTKNKRAKINISKLRHDNTKNQQPPFNKEQKYQYEKRRCDWRLPTNKITAPKNQPRVAEPKALELRSERKNK
ncbi:20284_t:CDS:2, partial [Gigaspora rosea]